MTKSFRIITVILLIMLLVLSPVSAGRWKLLDDIVNSVFKPKKAPEKETLTPKPEPTPTAYVVKEPEEAIKPKAKNTDEIANSEHTIEKGLLNEKTLDDLVEEEYQKRYHYKKFSLEKERVLKNNIKGGMVENLAKKTLCSDIKAFCYSDYNQIKGKLSPYSWPQINNFIITGDANTRRFIREYIDPAFDKKPDFIEVFHENGKIRSIKILDAKTSEQAIRSEQNSAYKQVCSKARFDCEVEYVIPKSQISSGNNVLGCLATGILIFGPDPSDLLCFLIV